MTNAPAADQLRLLDLQRLDTRTAQLNHRRRSLPELGELATLQTELDRYADRLVVSRTALDDARRQVAKADADVEQVRTRAARDQARLDSGQGSAKDLQALQSELVSLAKRISDLEDVELEALELQDQLTAELAELEQAEAEIRSRRSELESARDTVFEQVDAELASVDAERTELVPQIDAGLIALYDKVRAAHDGLGAAPLRARRCEGCRLELTPAELSRFRGAVEDQVLRCEECGRILVRTPDSGL